MINAFHAAADEFKTDGMNPRVESLVDDDFSQTLIPEDHRVIRLARKAALNLGVTLTSRTIGGGADANVFFSKGIMAGVLGTGMTDVHTLNESIHIQDMENSAKLVMEILKVHAAGDLSW